MHQIRVHLEHLHHPIVGDKIYGTAGQAYLDQIDGELSVESLKCLILPRQALHACLLSVDWVGQRRSWESVLPPELARFSGGDDVGLGHG